VNIISRLTDIGCCSMLD